MGYWHADCVDPSHEPFHGPPRDTQDYASGDKIRHDADAHGGASFAAVTQDQDPPD